MADETKSHAPKAPTPEAPAAPAPEPGVQKQVGDPTASARSQGRERSLTPEEVDAKAMKR